MKGLYRAFASRRSFEAAQRAACMARPLGRSGRIRRLPWPLSSWTATRDLPQPPAETFRDWWRRERANGQAAAQPTLRPSKAPPAMGRAERLGDARTVVLDRIHDALGDRRPMGEVPRDYRRTSERTRHEIIDLFARRAAEYRATVKRVGPEDLCGVLAELCRSASARTLAAPPDLPSEWRPDGVELVRDDCLSPQELDALDGALTGCALAIAEVGAIVLDGGPAQGSRLLSLVPDYHLCVVAEDAIVDLVPEAIARLAPAVEDGRALTFIAGPSATSDIELSRVEGVHGPRTLHIVIVVSG